ncbi:hypothetical protein [Flavobacterium sp. NRK1]|uniref:hypothetical protein n=1 Tax=Flavobacterium sp. NRK1 TaxID=2954929 RepID=UPI002092F32F|nr:hypothetical protein [Flavobacterium sp. NRK1]MCO6147519.1 hypothetical protein [Flavobacterium sp. NRK1]
MPLLLYINGQLADLEAGQVIAQTKQVNDLNSLDNRQANYTNKFKLPKTATNIRIMNFLTLAGNGSNIPYQKNECSLYSDTGECFVYNGWAVVTDGGDSYDAVVYDGIIDLYKEIENKNISTIDLTALKHTKNLSSVIQSWNEGLDLKYRYILADYNGKTGYTVINGQPRINVDYLVPSVNVAWLWHQIITKTYGITYTGSVFNTQEFKNLWMTYPKGVTTQDEGTEVFTSSEFTNSNAPFIDSDDSYWRTLLLKYTTENDDYLQYFEADPLNFKLRAKESGNYRLNISCNINTKDSVRLFISKNVNSNNNNDLALVTEFKVLATNLAKNTDFETEIVFPLTAGESISLLMRHPNGTQHAVRRNGDSSIELTINKINYADISFNDAFADFSVKDFLSEVIHRFGLTLFKNKYNNNYEFLTLQEILQSPNPVDLSRRFVKKISENYIYGSYAQNNWFRYNYNDKENNHYDSAIQIDNVNLPESKDIIKSKIYSPEKQKSGFMQRSGNVYKLWEKEIDDDPEEGEDPIKYKALDKRFYFLRAEYVHQNINLFFDETQETGISNKYYAESYWKLPFYDIIAGYYNPVNQILSKAQVVTAELYLTDADVAGFDFRKLYYLEQFGAYFIMNKISNYISGKPVKCEMIRIMPDAADLEQQLPVTINKVTTANYAADVFFTVAEGVTNLTVTAENDNGTLVINQSVNVTMTPVRLSFSIASGYKIKMQAGGYTTSAVTIYIPSYQTIIVS